MFSEEYKVEFWYMLNDGMNSEEISGVFRFYAVVVVYMPCHSSQQIVKAFA